MNSIVSISKNRYPLKNRTSRKIKPNLIPADAVISDTAEIGMKCKVGHYSKIGQNCRIGDNVVIGDCVTIEQNTTIGNNCVIQSGVVIGVDGFAYERDEQSFELERFPHIGEVKIGNNVPVSCNCSIARGSLSDTIIGDDTKLDALSVLLIVEYHH